jgi:hypothetical protein
MKVASCKECPFFRETPFSEGIMGIFASEELRRLGTCNYDRGVDGLVPSIPLGMEPSAAKDEMRRRLKARLVVKDSQNPPPADCPLRREPITIALKLQEN